LLERKQVLVQDEVEAEKPADVWWFLHTRTTASLNTDKTTATLSGGNVRLAARILSPKGATFEVMEARPLPTSPNPPMQNKNEGVRKLAIHLKDVNDLRLAVLLVPLREDEVMPKNEAQVVALKQW
jgi:hypothetical protein